jgi:hypothetical protein
MTSHRCEDELPLRRECDPKGNYSDAVSSSASGEHRPRTWETLSYVDRLLASLVAALMRLRVAAMKQLLPLFVLALVAAPSLSKADAANNTDSRLFYSYTTDGANTWSPNFAVTNSFNPFLGYPNQNKMAITSPSFQMIPEATSYIAQRQPGRRCLLAGLGRFRKFQRLCLIR